MRGRRADWQMAGTVFALLLATILTFRRVVLFDFVRWDDDINITQNPLLTAPWSWNLLPRFFDANQALRFEPLHWLADRLASSAFGFDSVAWHAINLGQHALVAVLFYFVLRRLISLVTGEASAGRTNLIAFLSSAVWALHPLRAEVVAWATASTYSFTAIWLLASFGCYLESVANPARRTPWWVLAWLLAIAAYASYPVSLTYAVFLIIIDGWLWKLRDGPAYSSETNSGRRRLTLLLLFLVPAIIAAAFTLWSRYSHPGIFTDAPTLETVGPGSRIATALASLTFLAWRLVWPFGLTPNVPPMSASGDAFPATFTFAIVALAVLLFAWLRRRRYPGFAAICFSFAAISLPCIGLTERPTWPVDRYSYVAHFPLIAGLGCWAAVYLRTAVAMRCAAWAIALVLGGEAVGAARQILIWRTLRPHYR